MRRFVVSGLAFLLGLGLVSGLSACGGRKNARPPAAHPPTAVAKDDPAKSAPVASSSAASVATASPKLVTDPRFAEPPPNAGPLPPSVRVLLAEQKEEITAMVALTQIVGDERGRARARTEVTALATELTEIEGDLDQGGSAVMDRSVTRLKRLETRIGILHETLRAADPAPQSPKARD
jgi:hypothetical protein